MNAPAILPSIESDTVVVQARAAGRQLLELARAQVVDSADSREEATELVARSRKLLRDCEARRVSLVKPLNDQVRQVNDVFRDVAAPVKEADTVLSRKILDFKKAEDRRAAEAAAAAERQRLESEALLREAEKAETEGKGDVAGKLLEGAVARESGAAEAQARAVLPPKTIASGAGTVTARKLPWTFRVVDLEQVPKRYWRLDEAAIRTDIRAGAREIPGLAIYQEEGLAVR